jgi:hypothetical protein
MRDEAKELAELLNCLVYTTKVSIAKEKEELLRMWLATPEQPYIIVILALSTGFNYIHIWLVIHINEPDSLIDFI